MWHNLIRTFERTVVLNSHQIFSKNNAVKTPFNYGRLQQRSLVCSAILRNTESVPAGTSGINDLNTEYIVPYKIEYENPDNARKLIDALRTKFCLSKKDVEQIVSNELVSRTFRQKSLMEALEIVCAEGATKKVFVEYPWLITLDSKKLSQKIRLLKTINGYRDLYDFVPLLRLQMPRLYRLVSSLNREADYVEHGNRIYFIAEKLNLPASTVTRYLVKRLFVLEMPWEMFKANLEHLINYNVEPMNILKDLWGFRYAPKAVETRLKRALQAKKDKIMPWMVRCPESILEKSLQITLNELKVLDGKTSVAEYLGERLGFTAEEAQAIMNKHPQVNKVRVTKIKEILDYLLDEAQFTRYEIAQVPRILCHSLKTTKQRLEELQQYGCRPSSLVIVCRSKREYDKFLKQWLKTYYPNKNNEQQEDVS